jgi:hypothetical protein
MASFALVRRAVENITSFSKYFGAKKTNALLVAGNKLTNNITDNFTCGFGPDVAYGPTVVRAVFLYFDLWCQRPVIATLLSDLFFFLALTSVRISTRDFLHSCIPLK